MPRHAAHPLPDPVMQPTRPICLASTSPRRRELLERFGLQFARFSPEVDERVLPGELPEVHVRRLAAAKAHAAREAYPDHLILAGDTVVEYGGAILGKPVDVADGEAMLTRLSGATHRVVSGYALYDGPGGEVCDGVVETRVTFRRLPMAWIRWYVRLDESRDKAGAYGIQGIGGAMVERIEGSYSSVVGFPVEAVVWAMLERGWLTL